MTVHIVLHTWIISLLDLRCVLNFQHHPITVIQRVYLNIFLMQLKDILIIIQKNLKQIRSHPHIAGQLALRWVRGDAECLASWQRGGGLALLQLWEGQCPREPPRCLAAVVPTGPAPPRGARAAPCPLTLERGPQPAPAKCNSQLARPAHSFTCSVFVPRIDL